VISQRQERVNGKSPDYLLIRASIALDCVDIA
jgi:hypothetical protein